MNAQSTKQPVPAHVTPEEGNFAKLEWVVEHLIVKPFWELTYPFPKTHLNMIFPFLQVRYASFLGG